MVGRGDIGRNLYRTYDNPVVLTVCALFMPVTLIAIGGLGMTKAGIETSIYELWAPESTDFRKDTDYKKKVFEEAGIEGEDLSLFLSLSVPRDGGSHTRGEMLTDVVKQLNKTERETTVTVNGNTYNWEDVCYHKEPGLPCIRITAMDAFVEGGYKWGTSEAVAWYDIAVDALVKQSFINYLLAGPIPPAADIPGILTGQTAAPPMSFTGKSCFVSCWGVFKLGLDLGTTLAMLPEDPTCFSCMLEHEGLAFASLGSGAIPGVQFATSDQDGKRDWLYFATVRGSIPVLGVTGGGETQLIMYLVSTLPEPLGGEAKVGELSALFASGNANDTALYMQELTTIANSLPESALQLVVDAIVAAPPFNLIKGESNAYNFQLGEFLFPLGAPRPSISNSTEENNAVLSGPVYWYDEGTVLPPFAPKIIVGGARPVEYSAENHLKFIGALEHLFPIAVPRNIRTRVARDDRPGGPITITEDEATEVLYEWKKAMEKVWSEDWNNDASGPVQYLGFTDDAGGALGTVGNEMKGVTTSGLTLSFISFAVIFVVTVAFLFNCNLVRSRGLVGFCGVCLALLAVFGAFGLTALTGVKFNLVQMWIVPFLLVGIGVDDMYVSTLAVSMWGEKSGPEAFPRGMSSVLIPISMTSFVNLGIFALFDISDIQAVYQVGRTAMYAVAFLYLTFITSYPALLKLDTMRRESGRKDVLCCVRERQGADDTRKGFMYHVFSKAYMPMMQSRICHAVIILISAALLGVAVYGMFEVKVGLDLEDFFEAGTQTGECMRVRVNNFPVWPAEMNWGQIDYSDPQEQLKMYKTWEKVGADYYMQTLSTNLVWTARYAMWGTHLCLDLGETDRCGHHWGCTATWIENTLGLRNDEVPAPEGPGVCKTGAKLKAESLKFPEALRVPLPADLVDEKEYCPVFVGQTESEMGKCLGYWANFSATDYGLVSPGYPTEDDDLTPMMPIKYSRASASALYSINLNTNDDYVNMIENTRAHCDEDESTHCWMSGVGYTFWEQYLALWDVFALLAGCTIAGAWVFSFIFLIGEFGCGSSDATLAQKYGAAVYGASMITAIVAAAFVTTTGLCSLLGVNLTIFTAMAYMMSVGFAVEYSVHIAHRFLVAPAEYQAAEDRVMYSMEMLFVPTFMAFLSSATGVAFMGFSKMAFVRLYFFTPLMIVILDTYFYGCYLLPTLLTYLGCSCVYVSHKEGKILAPDSSAEVSNYKNSPEDSI